MCPELVLSDPQIAIMVTRNHRDPVGSAQIPQPCGRQDELGRQAEIDQIAGDHDVVGRACLEVALQRRQDLDPMNVLLARAPGQIAKEALAQKVARGERRQRSDMEVRKVGQSKRAEGRSHEPSPNSGAPA